MPCEVGDLAAFTAFRSWPCVLSGKTSVLGLSTGRLVARVYEGGRGTMTLDLRNNPLNADKIFLLPRSALFPLSNSIDMA